MNEKWKKKLANAANNDDYVKLNTGLMRVSDLNNYLSSFPSNLLAFNKLGKFTYYKQLPGMNYNPPELGETVRGSLPQIKHRSGKRIPLCGPD